MIEKFLCQIDHLSLQRNSLFLFGWGLHPEAQLLSAELQVTLLDGRLETVSVDLNKTREDVALAFPHVPYATSSGFMAMAGWSNALIAGAVIEFVTTQGHIERVMLDVSQGAGVSNRKSVAYLAKRAIAYLRMRRFDLLKQKFKEFDVHDFLRIPDRNIKEMSGYIAKKSCRLVVDHAMGGGANMYREQRVSAWIEAGETIVLLSFKLATMSFGVTVRDNRGSKNFEIAELDNLQFAFRRSKLKEVFINCAVSFPQPLMLQKFILALVRNNYSRLVVAVHEYFFICPSHFLLNNEGQFCGVPNISQCNQCLPIHKDGFVSLTGARSISEWRDSWGTFLKRSDQILCFSTSSQILLKRAYPDLGTRILLQPHSVAPIQVIHFDKRVNNILTIGVLGAISEHKGSLIVGDLARAIEATTTLVRIVVIGTLDSSVKSSAITVTGNYEHDRLADIVEKYKVNIVLLPSICPETFSYVAHETIGMGLPLACFDLGAQAELVRGSKFGLIASSQEGPLLLKELQKFNQLINASNARATV